MKIVYVLYMIFFLIISNGCSNANQKNELQADRSKIVPYRQIVSDLNHFQYVPYYRSLKDLDFSAFRINTKNDSIFLKDSVKYYDSRQVFFEQNIDIAYWLSSFEKDTSSKTLWAEFQHPYSSNIDFEPNKPKSALNLMLSYLDGKEIRNYSIYEFREYFMNDKYLDLYKEVKLFLIKNKNKNTIDVRSNWKTQKRQLLVKNQ